MTSNNFTIYVIFIVHFYKKRGQINICVHTNIYLRTIEGFSYKNGALNIWSPKNYSFQLFGTLIIRRL
jgi:hypothetical protein